MRLTMIRLVVVFTEKKKRTASTENTQPFSEYFSVCTLFILILCVVSAYAELWRIEQQHHTYC